MALVQTIIFREPGEVDARLAELKVDRDRLLKVRAIAMSAAADSTPFHPANAAGTFKYQYGTWGLRNECVGEDWALDRPDGVEAISCDAIKVKIVFANVDVAANDFHDPKPCSRKGAGAERVCVGNLNLFGDLPTFAPEQQPHGWAIYYLMVDQKGAAELTRPVVKNGTFQSYLERIYLSDGSDLDPTALPLHDDDTPDNFDPQVVRK